MRSTEKRVRESDANLHDIVIKRLAGSAPVDDIVLEVSERMGWTWQQAADYVEAIRVEEQENIHDRRVPILAAVAFAIFIGGIGLIIYAVLSLQALLDTLPLGALNWYQLINFFFLSGYAVPATFSLLLMGTGMLLGSLVGMRRIWSMLLFHHSGD